LRKPKRKKENHQEKIDIKKKFTNYRGAKKHKKQDKQQKLKNKTR
jgi:hypothetical protein